MTLPDSNTNAGAGGVVTIFLFVVALLALLVVSVAVPVLSVTYANISISTTEVRDIPPNYRGVWMGNRLGYPDYTGDGGPLRNQTLQLQAFDSLAIEAIRLDIDFGNICLSYSGSTTNPCVWSTNNASAFSNINLHKTQLANASARGVKVVFVDDGPSMWMASNETTCTPHGVPGAPSYNYSSCNPHNETIYANAVIQYFKELDCDTTYSGVCIYEGRNEPYLTSGDTVGNDTGIFFYRGYVNCSYRIGKLQSHWNASFPLIKAALGTNLTYYGPAMNYGYHDCGVPMGNSFSNNFTYGGANSPDYVTTHEYSSGSTPDLNVDLDLAQAQMDSTGWSGHWVITEHNLNNAARNRKSPEVSRAALMTYWIYAINSLDLQHFMMYAWSDDSEDVDMKLFNNTALSTVGSIMWSGEVMNATKFISNSTAYVCTSTTANLTCAFVKNNDTKGTILLSNYGNTSIVIQFINVSGANISSGASNSNGSTATVYQNKIANLTLTPYKMDGYNLTLSSSSSNGSNSSNQTYLLGQSGYYSFNGNNSSITTPITSNINTTGWTISFWAKINGSMTSCTNPQDMFVKGWHYRMYIYNSNCHLGFITGGINGTDISHFTTSTLSNESWTHLVYRYNHSGLLSEVFVNGVSVSSKTQSGVVADTSAFKIGGGGNSGSYFKGYIDDVRIYSRTLSNTEITTLTAATRNGILEENTTLTLADKSGNGNHLYMTNTTLTKPLWSTTGVYEFNGSNVLFGRATSSVVNTNTTWSMSAWVVPYTIGSGTTDNRIIVLQRLNESSYSTSAALEMGSTNKAQFHVRNTTAADIVKDPYTVSALNQSYHLMLTYNGSEYLFYVNNVLQQSYNDSFYGFGNQSFIIGAFSNASDDGFNGTIDDVRIWNTKLSSVQVSSVYNNQSVACSNLRGWYTFENDSSDSCVEATALCYQETANVSTSCGGLATGSYATAANYFYINYTIPVNALGAIWQTKEGTPAVAIINNTLPDRCFTGTTSVLQLRMFSNSSSTISRAECYNGTGFETVTNYLGVATLSSSLNTANLYDGNYSTGSAYRSDLGDWYTATNGGATIYDEGIYWNMTETLFNNTNLSSSVTYTTAMINWTTTNSSNSSVEYGTTVSFGSVASNSTLTNNHNIRLTGLTANTTYYYRIISCTISTCTENSSLTFTTSSISSISATTTNSTVRINWTSSISSNESINYGTTTSLGTYSTNTSFGTTHSRLISGLTSNTLYYYNITSCSSTDCFVSGPYNFTTDTITLVISNIVATPSITTAVITWDTDIASNSTVKYSTLLAMNLRAYNTTNSTTHVVNLSGLTADRQYYYNVSSCISGVCFENGSYIFYTGYNVTSLCSGISNIVFLPDVRNFNFSSGTITQYNLTPQNQTNCLFNSTASYTRNITARTNTTTTSSQRVYCGASSASKVEINSTPTTIISDVVNSSILCWQDLVSASSSTFKEINITVSG